MSIGILQHLAKRLVLEGAIVDAFDTYPHIGSRVSYLTNRDLAYEFFAAKFRRFVLPNINGQDLTDKVNLSKVVVPTMPDLVGELRAATFHGAKVGLAALSLTATYTKIASRDLVSDYGPDLQRNWVVAHLATMAAKQIDYGYDEVYVFNGRTAVSRPFCDIFETRTRLVRFEVGGATDSFLLFNGSVHDPEVVAQHVLHHTPDLQAGSEFFKKNRARSLDAYSEKFSGAQRSGYLPDLIGDKKVVSMFSSSEDEYFAINDKASYGNFETQYDVAEMVALACQRRGDLFVVRLHPHLAIKHDHWKKVWDFEKLSSLGAYVLMPDDQADSYALIDASKLVISCGSTVGVEAAYSDLPSLMIGKYHATVLGICTSAQSAEDIERFLDDPMTLPGAREKAVLFASYARTSGLPIPSLTDGKSVTNGRIDGRLIDPARSFVNRLRHLKF